MVYLSIVSLVWAFSFVIIKGSLTGIDSHFVSFARMALSCAIFLPFLRLTGASRLEKAGLAAIGAVQFGLMYIAYIASFRYLPAHIVALATTTTPLFVTVINDLFTKKIHPLFFLSALIAVCAGVVIKYPDQPPAISVLGILLLQVSNLAFAFGQVAYTGLMARNPALKNARVFGLMYLGAVAATGAVSLVATDFGGLHPQPSQLLSLVYLGVIASGVCFFLWNKGATQVNRGALAVMNNMKIPLAIFASLFILREHTDYVRLAAGCGLMALGLYINCIRQQR